MTTELMSCCGSTSHWLGHVGAGWERDCSTLKMPFLNIYGVYLHRKKNSVKEKVFYGCVSFWIISGLSWYLKKEISLTFCIWDFNDGFSLSAWTCSQFFVAFYPIFFYCTSWWQKWQSLEIFKSRFLLLVLLVGHLVSFLVCYTLFKKWD